MIGYAKGSSNIVARHTSSEGASEHLPLTVSFPYAATLPVEWIGNKGLYLNQLMRAQIPVPPTVCITPAAYRLTLQQLGVDVDQLATMSYQELMAVGRNIQTKLMRQPLPTAVFEALQQLWRGLKSADALGLVLRPSMPYHPAHDFARRLRPILNIRGLMELERALKLAWAYLWTEDVLYYRCYHGHQTQRHDDLALLVQVQVPSETSGTLLNFQPAHAGTSEYVIESTWGLNDAVTRGLIIPDHFVCTPEGHISQQHMGQKKLQLTVGKEGAISEQALPEDRQNSLSLTPEQVQLLGQWGQRCSQLLHQAPLEMEWVLVRDKLFIVQLTPVDKVHLQAENEAEWPLAEHLSPLFDTPFSPLGWSLLAPLLEPAWRSALGMVGVPQTDLPAQMFHILNYRACFHQSLDTLLKQRWQLLQQTYQKAYRQGMWQFVRQFMRNQSFWYSRFQTYTMTLRRLWAIDFAQAAPETLFSLLDQTLGAVQTFIEAYVFVALSEQELRLCLQAAWTERQHQRPETALPPLALLLAAPDNRRGQSARMVDACLTQIRSHPRLSAVFRDAPAAQLREQLDSFPEGQTFLAHFHRVLGMVGLPEISADPLQVSWAEDPRLGLAYLQRRLPLSAAWKQAQAEAQAQAWHTLLSAFKGPDWVEQGLWRFLLPLTRQYVGIRQDLPFYVAMVQPLLRQLLLALARHLPLEQPEAVFYLTLDELRHLLKMPLDAYKMNELHELVQARQLEQYVANRINPDHVPPHLQLQGLPANGGRYFGRLRVVSSTADLEALRHGDVLVTDYFEPHWEPAFAKIAGLITDLGGVTSHGARLARQYRVPAITAVPNASQRLKTGQVVSMNAFTGQVQAYQPEDLQARFRA
jgi:phosphohistidine swiveling domain-containing protein/uncharacterized membrane protein YbaN (DUF454 family)